VLDDGERAICADFCWREQKLIVETDGKKTHLTHQAFERDRRDDQRLIAAGWTVIRITWKQLETEPDRIIALITECLSRNGDEFRPYSESAWAVTDLRGADIHERA
jgi:very-short-patch-repair endonuclease